jgi:hypothetical protein
VPVHQLQREAELEMRLRIMRRERDASPGDGFRLGGALPGQQLLDERRDGFGIGGKQMRSRCEAAWSQMSRAA